MFRMFPQSGFWRQDLRPDAKTSLINLFLRCFGLFFFLLEKERGNEETVGQWEEARVPWQMSPLFQRDAEWQPQGVQGGAEERW